MAATPAERFEDHCWKDVVDPIAACGAKYARKLFVGKNPALLAIDLYKPGL